MIVNYSESGWDIITQRAHGMLAAQFALHWKKPERPQRWMETLLAIAEHDDAEVELDGEKLITENGGPLNFTMKSFELAHCRKLAMLTITKSRYIALLVSMHMNFLYSSEEKDNVDARTFLQEQRKLQGEWRKELNLKKTEAEDIYSFVEWCDACSLLLCQRQLQPEKRAIEISYGPDKSRYYLHQLSDDKITLDPWPFEPSAFTVNFESRMISQLQFESSAQFREIFLKSPVQETVWQVVNEKIPPPAKKSKV